MSVQAVIEQAMLLSVDEREQIIAHLLAANANEEPQDPDWEAAWTAEIDRRMQDIREGRVELVEADAAFARVQAAADRPR